MKRYDFATAWRIEASLARVWMALSPDDQPEGRWSALERVETLRPGGEHGVGREFRLTMGSPHGIRFVIEGRIVERVPRRRMVLVTKGDLEGEGTVVVRPSGGATEVTILWSAIVHKPWMAKLGTVLSPLFRFNHDRLMDKLGAEVAARAGGRLAP
jgi:uncharacterized protein YndB with AHSA1/START domain